MISTSLKAAERDRLLIDCKAKIKKWEENFVQQQKRKPEKEDMKNAPRDIQDRLPTSGINNSTYNNNQKKQKKLTIPIATIANQSKPELNQPMIEDDDVFGSAFNKSNHNITVSNSKPASNLLCYSLKLQNYAIKQTTDLTRKVEAQLNESTEEKTEFDGKTSGNEFTVETISINANEDIEDDVVQIPENHVKNKQDSILKINNLLYLHMSQRKKTTFTRPINVWAKNKKSDLFYKSKIEMEWLERCLLKDNIGSRRNSSKQMDTFDSDNRNVKPEMVTCFSYLKNKEISEKLFNNFDESAMKPSTKSFINNLNEFPETVLNGEHSNSKNIGALSPSICTENSTEYTPSYFPVDVTPQLLMNETSISLPDDDNSPTCKNIDCSISSKRPRFASNTWIASNMKCGFDASSSLMPNVHPIQTDKSAHIKRKLLKGTINENFVKINIKKKKFVRHYKHLTAQQYKKQKWKTIQKQKKENEGKNYTSSSSCFECGKQGHWARNCPNKKVNKEMILEEDFDNSLPTLEEAAAMAQSSQHSREISRIMPKENYVESAECMVNCEMDVAVHSNFEEKLETGIHPIFNLTDDGQVMGTTLYVHEALNELGFSTFRPGQEKAIMRILSGMSTLFISSTGSGKSLCYQLPAYIYAKHFKCVTMVISPLLSLMEDQASGQLHNLRAVCIHSGMTPTQRQHSLDSVQSGKAHVLLVSPEAIVSYGNKNSLLPQNLPPVPFVCIDEAHCLSEWSHNFRPSYLQLQKVLTNKLGIKCILALTATATKSTALDIANHLHITNIENAVIGQTTIPENLTLSISCEKYRDEGIIELLQSDTFSKCNSVIVYCTRREDTERLATLIRTRLQDVKISIEKQVKQVKTERKTNCRNLAWDAVAYHAGLSATRRKSIQARFMSGRLRVIVATVAFGMGLDKSDIHGIIHYNMPKSFESYVQEIGRAGRDGLPSNCHLFLDPEAHDIYELRRHIYANSIDRHIIRRFLGKVFQCHKCQEKEIASLCSEVQNTVIEKPEENKCPGHEVAVPIDDVIQELNIKEENLLTLLCYLELHYNGVLEILQPTYATCTVQCYEGYCQLVSIARKCPPIAVAMALNQERENLRKETNKLTFSIMEVASKTGWDSGLIKKVLKDLEWDTQHLADGRRIKKTGVIVQFSNLAFHVKVKCNLSEQQQDEMLEFLYKRVVTQERSELWKLQRVYTLFESMSSKCLDFDVDKSHCLKHHLQEYFMSSHTIPNIDSSSSCISNADMKPNEMDENKLDEVRDTIRKLVCTHHDKSFTGRTVAQILYGIDSPCFPAKVWNRARNFWRAHLDINFNKLISMANEEILKLK